MDEVFDYIHSCNHKDLEEIFKLKMEMETIQKKHHDNRKENEKDDKKIYNKQYKYSFFIFWLKNDLKKYYLYIVDRWCVLPWKRRMKSLMSS